MDPNQAVEVTPTPTPTPPLPSESNNSSPSVSRQTPSAGGADYSDLSQIEDDDEDVVAALGDDTPSPSPEPPAPATSPQPSVAQPSVVPPPSAPPVASTAAAPPAPAPTSAAPSQPPATQAPVQTQTTEVVQQQQPQPQATSEPQKSLAEVEAETQAKLTEYYALDPQTASKLITEPEAVLPALAARVHAAVFQAITHSVVNNIPKIVQAQIQNDRREAQATEMFYSAGNQDLKPYDAQVRTVGAMYRQQNPNASPEEAIRTIAAIVRASLNLQPPKPTAVPTQPQRPGFVPAAVAGSAGAAIPASTNPFTELATAKDDDDF